MIVQVAGYCGLSIGNTRLDKDERLEENQDNMEDSVLGAINFDSDDDLTEDEEVEDAVSQEEPIRIILVHVKFYLTYFVLVYAYEKHTFV